LIISLYFYETFSNLTSRKQAHALHSLDTLSDVRTKLLALPFRLRCSVYPKPKPTLLGASITFVNNL